MCAKVSRNACQNCGPDSPCGLLSNPCSLGHDPQLPLLLTEGLKEPRACGIFSLSLLSVVVAFLTEIPFLAIVSFSIKASLPRVERP